MNTTITLYTREGCILCSQVRDQLRAANVEFREVAVDAKGANVEALERKQVRTFPALFLGDRYLGGFSHVVYLLTRGRLQQISAEGVE